MLKIKRSFFSKNNKIFIFYMLMLLVLLSWNDYNTAPPQVFRYLYLSILFVPTFFGFSNFSLLILSLFYPIGVYGYSFTYMPYSTFIYGVLLLAVFLLRRKKFSLKKKTLSFYISVFLLLLLLIVDLSTSFSIENVHWCLFIFIVLFYCQSSNPQFDCKLLKNGFILTSVVLSYQFLTYGSMLASDFYISGVSTERLGFRIDPNYLGGIIGMGGIISFINLLKRNSSSLYQNLFWAVTLVLCLSALGLNASRGAIVAFAIATLPVILFQKVKLWYKLIFIVFVAGVIYFCYTNEMFDILANRFETEHNGGSGRLQIWQSKLSAFFNEAGLLQLLFGFGRHGGLLLGCLKEFGAHNEFVAMLVEYGFFGLFLLLSLFISILKSVPKGNFPEFISYLSFLLTICFTLEPLTQGWIIYWIFLFYIVLRIKEVKYQNVPTKISSKTIGEKGLICNS